MERWAEANWRYVRGEIGRVAAAIEGALTGKVVAVPAPTEIPRELVEQAPAIMRLCQAFELGPFERDIVIACAGGELDSEFARRTGIVRPSLGLALAAFADGHVGVLAASAPLRRYRIVEPLDGSPLVAAPLVLDDRIAQFIAGSDALDARLARSLREITSTGDDASEIVPKIGAACELAKGALVVGLSEGGERERQATALAVCRALGRRLYCVRACDLPVDALARQLVRTLWERELRLQPLALLVEIEHDAPPEALRTASALVHDLEGLAFVSARTPIAVTRASYVAFELPRQPRAQRVAHLRRVLGERAAEAGAVVDRIATQFVLGSDAIERACLSIESGTGPLADRLWAACRQQARPRLDDVARRIEPKAGWDDLVVPPDTLATLKALAAHVRHSAQVYEEWGFGALANRGLGTGALFAGTSGTGKTLAAEILAREAQLDLYHIDLSQIVNKYVGETEKNLRRVFDAAEDSGAILLFDEADSLFGKRGDVEKGTDRYANLEVSYLLQRMEAYRGVAILTTNQREAIDSAFLRRLRFVIPFPFPDAPLRVALWQRAFPPAAPIAGIDVHRLARLQLPGGNIRNVAINAAFLAAERGEPISMRHVLSASRSEFQKIERPFPEIEVQGWPS
jgi:hypothetical protein